MTDWARIEPDLRRSFAAKGLPPADVDDLVQAAAEKLVRADLRSAESLGPYVGRVVRSVWVDHLRRRRGHEALDEQQLAQPEALPPDLSAEVASWLPWLIDGLPEPYREVLTLVELEGLSQREAAERLGLSASGARTRVQRGRQRLREALAACCEVHRHDGRVVAVDRCGAGCEPRR